MSNNFFDSIPVDGDTAVAEQPSQNFFSQIPVNAPLQPSFKIKPTQDDLRAQQVAARNVQPATTLGELPKVLFTPSDETRARAAEQVRTHTLEPVDVLGADAGPIIKPTTPEDISTLTGLNPSSRAAKVASAVVTTPGQVANSFATPEGALMFASPAAGAAFVAQMATSVPQKLGAAAGAYSAGDKDTGDANLVEGLATAGMLALPAIHAFKAGKPLDEIIGPDKANQLRQQVISNPTVKDSSTVQNPNEPPTQTPPNPASVVPPATVAEAPAAAEPNAAAPDSTEPLNDGGLSADELAEKYGVNERGTINLEKPPLKVQPALKIDGKVYTGGDTHYDIKKSLPQDVQDEYTMAPDVDAQHIFLDQDGNELSRTDLQKAIGVSNSEDIPAANKIPKSLTPDEISAQTGANYDGEIKNSSGESVKGFTFKNPTHPLKGVTFNLKGDVTPEIVSAKVKELNDRFSGDAEHTIQEGEGGKFNIVNPSGKTLETFPSRAEAEKVLPEYNTPGIPSEVDKISKSESPEPTKPDSGTLPAPIPEGGATGLKFATLDKEREARGLEPLARRERVSDQATMDKAIEKLQKNPAHAENLVKELNRKPRSIDDVDRATLLLQKIDLRKQYDDAFDDLAKAHSENDDVGLAQARVRVADASDKLQELEEASGKSGSEQGAGLRALQLMANEDYSLAGLEQRARASKGGAPLTDTERDELVKTAADYKKSNDELQKHLDATKQRNSELEVKAALDKIALEAKNKTRTATGSNAKGLLSTLEQRANAARERIKSRPVQFNTGLDPSQLLASLRDEIEIGAYHVARIGTDIAKWTAKNLQDFNAAMKKELGEKIVPHLQTILAESAKKVEDLNRPPTHEENIVKQSAKIKESFASGNKDEIASQVQKLARLFVERGISGRDALVDAVHKVLQESDPEITRREAMDAISGYGDFKQLSKDEISKTLRDLKGQLQQVGKLEDIQSKKPPLKTGVERRTPSDEERKLIQQVNEAKRQFGVETTDKETQLKSALDARKTYYKNQITDLEKQIESKEKFVKSKTPAPSDAELVELKKKRDELKSQFDDIFNPKLTEAQKYQKSLEADKKALEKSIAEKQRKLREGDLAGKPKEMNRPADPTLEPLKQQRDALNRELVEARKKPAEQKYADAVQARIKALQKSIDEKEKKLSEGDFSPAPKPQNRPESTPELEQLKQRSEQLSKEISNARKKPEAQKYAEAQQRKLDAINKQIAEKEAAIKSGDVESKLVKNINRPLAPDLEIAKQKLEDLNRRIEEIRNPKKSPEEIALNGLKTRLQNRIDEMEEKIKNEDFSKVSNRKVELDRKAQELTAQKERVAKIFKQKQKQFEKEALSKAPRAADFISNLRRFEVLSGVSVLGKLAAYSATKIPTIGATEAIGNVISKIPKLGQIAAKAPSEGASSLANVARATAKGLTKGFEDAYKTARTGQSDLKAAFSSRPETERAWYNFFQTIHEVIKSPLRRTAFELSLSKRMESAARGGADITDPMTQLSLGKDAYLDSDRALLLENNRVANAIRVGLKNIEAPNKSTGRIPGFGKAIATLGRVELPILSVPFNYVKQTINAAFGIPIGLGKAALAFRNGIDKLDPHEADEILRHLKYGSIGGAAVLYGFYDGYKNANHPQNATFGGFYQPDEKRKKDQAGINGIKIGGYNVPGLLLHNPVIAAAQLGSTFGKILASKINKKTNQTHSVPVAAAASLAGLINESPIGTENELLSGLSDPRSAEYTLGNHVKSLAIPTGVQELAKVTDRDANGNVIKRDPKTFMQYIETGIPGLRQTVKKK